MTSLDSPATSRAGSPAGRRVCRVGTRRSGAPLALLLGAMLGGVSGCANGPVSLSDIGDAVGSGGGSNADRSSLSLQTIVQGLKEALMKGASVVVARLGSEDGFATDPVARIPLPTGLQKAADFADKVGLGNYFDDLELKLNRAAEAATPKARQLFLDSIAQMSVDDARGILNGSDDAATQYFQRTTGEKLTSAMRPIVDGALSEVGAVRTFNELAARYRQVPLAPELDTDLSGYVTDQARAGIFHYLAEQEKAIRENPLERTSDILRRVFGSQ